MGGANAGRACPALSGLELAQQRQSQNRHDYNGRESFLLLEIVAGRFLKRLFELRTGDGLGKNS